MSDKPPRKRTPITDRYDWEACRLDYESGVLNDASLAHKYGMTVGRLKVVARDYEWVRGPAPTAEDIYGKSPVPGRLGSSSPSSTFSPEQIAANGIATVQSVLNTHRRDIARVRGLSSLLIDRLGLLLQGTEVTLPCMGARESPADLVEKLSRVTVRVVQMERQAFGLDSMAQNPDGAGKPDDATVNAVMAEMEEFRQQLDDLSNAKAKTAVEK